MLPLNLQRLVGHFLKILTINKTQIFMVNFSQSLSLDQHTLLNF